MENKLTELTSEFLQKICKVCVTGEMNQTIINDFNENIPTAVRTNWVSSVQKILTKDENDLVDETRFLYSMITASPSNVNDLPVFKQILFEQEFISYFAHLESIFQEFQRFIYYKKPEYLPQEKEILWKDILELKDFSAILEYTIEQKLNKSGYLKISDLLIKLNSTPFLLKISVKNELQHDLNEFILIRNMIIHNGSKVSEDYEKFTEGKYKKGSKFILDRIIVNQLFDLIIIVSIETYGSVLEEIYGIEKKEAYDRMSYMPKKSKENYKKQKLKRK